MKLSPIQAIRLKCIECKADEVAEVRNCDFYDCVCWPYRLGKNPARKGVGGNPNLKMSDSTKKGTSKPNYPSELAKNDQNTPSRTKILTPLNTIRKECLDCMRGHRDMIRDCSEGCALHPFRFGENSKPNEVDKTQ